MDLQFIIDHIRQDHWSGVNRKQRVRSTGEVFTPTGLVIKYIDYCESQYPDSFVFPDNNFADSSCGDGQFLGEILIRKVQRGISFEDALSSLFGVDYQESNVKICRDRLLCKQEHLRHIVERNIVCHDALTYDYSFNGQVNPDGTAMTDEEVQSALLGVPPVGPAKQPRLQKVKGTPNLSCFE